MVYYWISIWGCSKAHWYFRFELRLVRVGAFFVLNVFLFLPLVGIRKTFLWYRKSAGHALVCWMLRQFRFAWWKAPFWNYLSICSAVLVLHENMWAYATKDTGLSTAWFGILLSVLYSSVHDFDVRIMLKKFTPNWKGCKQYFDDDKRKTNI